MRKLFNTLIVIAGLLTSCGGGPAVTGAGPQLAETPAGVDPGLWQRMVAELEQARHAAAAVVPALPRPTDAIYDAATHELTWAYELAGDYNQDGTVTPADLVPLAQHFGASSFAEPTGPGFVYSSIEAVIDGDRNGELGMSDITVIARHLNVQVSGYSIYATADMTDYPFDELLATYPPAGSNASTAYIGRPDVMYERSYMTAATAAAGAEQVPQRVVQVPAGLSAFSDAQRRAGRLTLRHAFTSFDPRWTAVWLRAEGHGLTGAPSLPAQAPVAAQPYPAEGDWDLAYDLPSQSLSWYYFLAGDTDYNGEVNVADLTPITAHWFEYGPWSVSDAGSGRDTDGDQVITGRDFRGIARYANSGVSGYAVFGTADPAAAASRTGTELLQLGILANEPNTGRGTGLRPAYVIDLSGFAERYVWMVPLKSRLTGTAAYAAPSPVLDRQAQ